MYAFSEGEIHQGTSPFIQRWHLIYLDYY
jgi:hypothetical protein